MGTVSHRIRIQLFGRVAFYVDEEEVSGIPRGKCVEILAILAVARGHTVRRDELAEALWPDEHVDSTRARLRQHLYELRNAIPGGRQTLLSDRDAVWLPVPIEVDSLSFELALRKVGDCPDEQRPPLLSDAIGLYRGPIAPELNSPRFDDLRRCYAGAFVDALRALAGLLADRDLKRAIECAARAVKEEPLFEECAADLIRLYARDGRPHDARREFRDLVRRLKHELGVEPSRELAAFVHDLPDAPEGEPIPRLAQGAHYRQVANPNAVSSRRLRKSYLIACSAFFFALIVTFRVWPRMKAQPAPLTPEQRIAIITRLRSLPTSPEIERERAEQCVELADPAWDAWYGREEETWRKRVVSLADDFRKSMVWLTSHDPPSALRLGAALGRYWYMLGDRDEPNRLLRLALDGAPKPTPWRLRALIARSLVLSGDNRRDQLAGLEAAREAVRLADQVGSDCDRALALRQVGLMARWLGRDRDSRPAYRLSLAIFRRLGDIRGMAMVSYGLGCMGAPGRTREEREVNAGILLLNSLALYRAAGNQYGINDAFNELSLRMDGMVVGPVTVPLYRQFLTEAHEQLRIQRALANNPQMHEVWRSIVRNGLKWGDVETVAQALRDFTPALSGVALDDRIALCAALQSYKRAHPTATDLHTELDRLQAYCRKTDGNDTRFNAAILRGSRLSLMQAAQLNLR